MEQMLEHLGEGTTVPNSSLQSQTSSAEQQSVEYEVFLSFRGPDVRKSFADCLYSYLVRSKIRTFRDEEELRKGETIGPFLVQAITESKIYIPIMTKSYASSKWCLQELAKMVECWKQGKGHIILPIFYFFDPKDVRHQTGPYEEAFEQHSKKHDPKIVQEWRTALQEVGQMKGWHVTELDGQGAVIDHVFSKVELHLRSNYTLVNEELVGIEVHVNEVTRLLNLDSVDGKIVGIHGIGGMGKTTIAKAVYDNICTNFSRSCFLENIQELLSKNDGTMVLQNKFISSILRDDVQVKDASEGVNIIRERVCKYRVLVVLDDVGDRFDFGQILGKLSNFSSESRFIITTRDRRVLELHQESKVYEPKEMSHDHAIQLFNKHAFGMHDPLEGYATMCDEFVKVAAKLPLALKVIGSLLFRREKQFWEEKLIELKEVPATNNKVQQRLKISYNELTHNERQIFLDIACFFIGEDKDLPFHMWNGCNFYPESGVTTLIHRSLIKLDGNNRLWMHDLLRDLGRAIVFEEDIKHPSKRSRIWTNEDAVDMLINGEGTNHNQVEMLRVDMRHCGYFVLTGNEFKTMSGLRYLDVRHGALMGNFNRILPEMQWLKLYECSSIPTHMNLKQVAVLDLHKCELTDDWRGWNEIQVAHRLKVINIYGCDELNRVPDLSQCRRLESVDLTYCSRMRGVLDISNFRNLKVVRFRETEITGLTGDMRKLQRLQEIETGKLVWTAEEVPVLPVSLKRLTISSHKVPNLLELENLEELCFMNGYAPLEIPGDIWRLRKLKTLNLFMCRCNGRLLVDDEDGALPSSLTSLIANWCWDLDSLPNIGNLKNLTTLRLVKFEVAEINGLGELRMLEVLGISESAALKNLNGLENLVHLEELTLVNCYGLDSLPSLSNLIKLHKLMIVQCRSLSEIQGLEELRRSLLHLEVSNCVGLINIQGLESLEALESLTLDLALSSSQYIDDESWMLILKVFKVSNHIMRENLNPYEPFPNLSCLQNVKQVYISGWIQLPEVTGLGKLKSLKSLEIEACESLGKLPDLSGLENLEELEIKSCSGLVDVTGLCRLESLQKLIISHCWSLEELPDVSGLKNLEELELSRCIELIEVIGLGKLENLQKLNMLDCISIKELPDMSGLKNLKKLNLKGCTKLEKLKGLERLDGLLVVEMDKKLKAKHHFKSASWCKKQFTWFVHGGQRT